jgi:DNA repair exonuclease SbcCD ATPase subunit/DNA repair exonuclease SbcCD nuclease subunit
MKIAHLSDTHIKNLKNHDEYKEIFKKIYDIMRDQKVDAIVHCGDIAHSKTQISPEFVDMAGDFFKNLSSIAPTYIILGNHDGNLRNNSRQDAITPIVSALNLPNLYLLKDSGEVKVNDQFTLNVMSVFDQEHWVKPSDMNKVNIALLHGSVAGVVLDNGQILEHGEFDVSIFEGHDFAFLGDIHKSNQILDPDGRVRYCGSTVQQNFGETDDKGFLIWDIKDKNDFTCKHYSIPNPRPFVTVVLNENGELPDISVPNGARMRLMVDKNTTLDKIKKATEVIKARFKPESVSIVNKAVISTASQEVINSIGHTDNLRDLGVQEKLIRDYLKDFKAEEEIIKKVLDLNKKFSSAIEEGDEIIRGVKWSLKNLEWDYLFNYGPNNQINFEQLSGIVGIFGKNYSGKSSIIDSLIYTIFNTTSKNNRKNLNVINQNSDSGRGKAVFEIEDATYTIERKSDKYLKKSKGVESVEAKTDVEFTSSNESLNGLARNDTDKNIRRYMGTVDDFFLTSMASQFGYLSFISEGSTKRKEILAKFLDLENFDKKFKLAKEESAELKSLLKKMEGIDYKRDIAVAEAQLAGVEDDIKERQQLVEQLKKKVSDANETLCELQKCIASVPNVIVNFEELKRHLEKSRLERQDLISSNEALEKKNTFLRDSLEKANAFLSSIDKEELKQQENNWNQLAKELDVLEADMSSLEREISSSDKKVELLKQVPCGDNFPQCKFIKDAFLSKQRVAEARKEQEVVRERIETALYKYGLVDEVFSSTIQKITDLTKNKNDFDRQLVSNELAIEKNKNRINTLATEIFDLEEKMNVYINNKDAIENYERLLTNREDSKKNITSYTKNLTDAEHQIVELYKSHGSISAKIEIFRKQEAELEELRKEFSAYHLFLTCMHPNGISYEIIKNKLPDINAEIAKVLANIVDFSVYLVNDDDKLDIMIKHPKYDDRPLEMGSGAEKTLASTAIRLALLNVTTLPVGDIFIMDEPGTALDSENLEGFTRILDLIKGYFKTVIIISHLDSLKDCVDMQIVIDKKNNFAYVNQ